MTARRLKLAALLGGLAGAGLALLATTQPWLTAHGDSFGSLAAGADTVAPSVTALAVAALALVAALAIANLAVRRVLAIVQLVLGLGVAAATLRALIDPVTALIPAVTEATGIAGNESVVSLTSRVDTSLWPSIALVGAGILILTAVVTLVFAARWPGSSPKYGPTATGQPVVNEWDALSNGTDPTD